MMVIYIKAGLYYNLMVMITFLLMAQVIKKKGCELHK